jgi:hypothetical protein
VLLAAVVVAASAVVDAVRGPSAPAAALVVVGLVVAWAVVTGAVVGTVFRWQAGSRFEVDEPRRAFRTPRSAAPVFLVIFLLAVMAFPAEVGGWSWAHGDRDPGWIVVVVSIGVLVLPFAVVGWRGHGVVLTPGGIHADRTTGALVIPWTALSAGQRRPSAPTKPCIDLVFAHPEQVSRRGLIVRPNRISFEGTQPAFVTAVIRHYAAHPANRAMIGTPAEHRRLVELLAVPPGRPEPPPSRRRIVAYAAAGVLVFGVADAGDTWVYGVAGRHSVLGYASELLWRLLAGLSFYSFAAAVRGVHARRRPAAQPPQPTPPRSEQHASSPAWARDVTHGH